VQIADLFGIAGDQQCRKYAWQTASRLLPSRSITKAAE
jgi:hypothetical protein